jgi:NAD(P)-dependent dehydrogenase (short-subunit alcohol dehydrogenase family)
MVAVITGAGSGLGAAISRHFVSEGRTVALLERDEQKLSAVAATLEDGPPTKVGRYIVDVSDEAQVAHVFEQLRVELGSASILINCAGIADMQPAIDMPGGAFNRVLAINVSGTYFCAQQAARQMRTVGKGRIVNFASVSGLRASVGRIAYGTSKAAVVSLTAQLAVEWAEYGITVNALAPGPIESPMSASLSDAAKQSYLSRIPAKRYGNPADIVGAVAYLVSDAASFVTGHTLVVDGGFTVFGLPAF